MSRIVSPPKANSSIANVRASHLRAAAWGIGIVAVLAACSFGPATYNGPNVPPAPEAGVDSGGSEDAAGGDAASEDATSGEDGSGEDSSAADTDSGLDGGSPG
jgi:hypothetical protein